MRSISFALPLLALASAEASQTRKLDVTKVDPTPSPTSKPTPSPTPAPTGTPTISHQPSVSHAPTTPRAPECRGEFPFCYDGYDYGYGGGYTQCYVLEESELCGTYDFMIEGINATSGGRYNFDRCSNVWDWFVACAASKYTSCEKREGGTFTFDSPYTYVNHIHWRQKWQFRMQGRGVIDRLSWYCDTEEDARGMKHLADWINGHELFKTPVGTCATDSPSVSPAPTTSPAPTNIRAPKCADTGNPDYVPMDYNAYKMKNTCKGTNGGSNCFKVSELCEYTITGTDVGDGESYNNPEEWFLRATELFAATPIDTSGTFTSKPMDPESITYAKVDDQYLVTIAENEGLTGGQLQWSFEKSWYAQNYRNFWAMIFKAYPKIWETDTSTNTFCGSGPFCYDDKDYTMCRVDPHSENCGPFDFVIEGESDYGRGGEVWEWFAECVNGYGCERYQTGTTASYNVPWGRRSWNVWHKRWEFSTNSGGGDGVYRWHCPDEESAMGIETFFNAVKNSTLFEQEAFFCTESPSESPTACTDSFFTKPPLNIAVVIDTSYSTFDTQFDGSNIGDINGDGAANTILDAEIEATLGLLNTILEAEELDNSNVNIGIVVFDTEATYEGHFNPLNDENNDLNPLLVDQLKKIKTQPNAAGVLENNIGFTNFDDALDKSIYYFQDPTVPADRTNLLVFLSDGKPNVRGDGDDEPWCPAADCLGAPANKPDDQSLPDFEKGQLSFCYSGDTGCDGSGYEFCARSEDCLGEIAAKMYDSELAELDDLDVHRLAIGVGSKSYTAKDSGLWLIDNNPMKESHNVLPRQVLTSDDLITALRDLCPENTPRPTGTPTAGPTASPTSSPTRGPTRSPTASPTASPTVTASKAPSASPSEDFCDYHEIDFTSGANGRPTGSGSAYTREWEEYGMYLTAVTDQHLPDRDPKSAFYYQTGVEGVGKTLIIQAEAAGDVATMNPSGGQLIIKLDMTHDKGMKLDFYDVASGGSVSRLTEEGHIIGDDFDLDAKAEEAQSVVLPVNGVFEVVITFNGRGALSQMNVCRNPNRTPSPIGLSPETDTREPTAAPNTPPPTAGDCPDDIKLIGGIGSTDFDNVPLSIVDRNGTHVTLEVVNAFTRRVARQYVMFYADREEKCYDYEDVDETIVERFTAECMEHVALSVVHVYVSDESLSETDDAEIPECCHGPETDTFPKVEYTFQVYCEPQCVDDEENEV